MEMNENLSTSIALNGLSTSMPKTYMSPEQKKEYTRDIQIEKYYNYLMHHYNACKDGYAKFVQSEMTCKYKVPTTTYLTLVKMGYIKGIGDRNSKKWHWKVSKPTENMAEEIWNRMKNEQRLYKQKKEMNAIPKNANGKQLVKIIQDQKESTIKSTLTLKDSQMKDAESLERILAAITKVKHGITVQKISKMSQFFGKLNVNNNIISTLLKEDIVTRTDDGMLLWSGEEPSTEMCIRLREICRKMYTKYASKSWRESRSKVTKDSKSLKLEEKKESEKITQITTENTSNKKCSGDNAMLIELREKEKEIYKELQESKLFKQWNSLKTTIELFEK